MLYEQTVEDCMWEGMFSREQLKKYLERHDYYTELSSDGSHAFISIDDKIKLVTKDIENLKVGIYECLFRTTEKKRGKQALKIANRELERLLYKKSQYNHLTLEGYAQSVSLMYLLLESLRNEQGDICGDDFVWAMDILLKEYNASRIDDNVIREIARTEPWRSLWSFSKNPAEIFSLHPVVFTENQKSLILWTKMYDAVFESHDCPSNEVIEDDDALDGWLIMQRRKREKHNTEHRVESAIKNEKIRNSQEIFLPADSIEGIQKIQELNDTAGRIITKQRFHAVKQHGSIKECDLPDQQQKLRMEYVKRTAEKLKGK